MTLYLLIAGVIFIISTVITFLSKAVSNQHFLAHLVLFPIIYITCGLPVQQIGLQFLAAGLMLIIGFVAFVYFHIGGGAARALIIAALWVPGFGLLFEYLTIALIIIGAICLIDYLIRRLDRVDHFATLVFAICSVFLFYQYDVQTKQSQILVTPDTQTQDR